MERMHFQILITDDLAADREGLISDIEMYLAGQPSVTAEFHCYDSGEALLGHFSALQFQLAFLDICMDGMNGIELARTLRSRDGKLLIVFLTTSREYAFEAFPVHPFDYLVKPYRKADLKRVLDEAILAWSQTNEPKKVVIRAAYASYEIPLDGIVSVLSYGHSVEINMLSAAPLRSIMTFAELEKMLQTDPRFLTCNRGVLINMDHVETIQGDTFLMKKGPACAIRVRDRARLVTQFSQYQILRMKSRR